MQGQGDAQPGGALGHCGRADAAHVEAALLQAREAIALTKVWHSNKLHKYLVLPRANEAIAAIDSVGVTK